MSAPELSAAEREIVARFEAAPEAEESLRERVARAIWVADEPVGSRFWTWNDATPATRHDYRLLALAALDVLRGQGR